MIKSKLFITAITLAIISVMIVSCSRPTTTPDLASTPTLNPKLETPPSRVPAAPNDSTVTAKILDIIRLEGDVPWEIIVKIQNSEDAPEIGEIIK